MLNVIKMFQYDNNDLIFAIDCNIETKDLV